MSDQEPLHSPSEERATQDSRQPEQPQRQRGGRSGGERGGRRRHQQQQNQARRPESMLNLDELRDLVELIAEHGFTDFEIEREGIRIRLRRDLAPQIIAAPPASTSTPQNVLPATTPTTQSQAHVGGAQSTAATPPGQQTPHPGAQAEVAASEDEGLHIITSPIVGSFYRSPSPTAEPFVKIGSHVGPDTVVCIIEAMKLMNEILAETSGEVAKIYVENGQPVEYGQPLFGIKS